jgi:hypothetical protein
MPANRSRKSIIGGDVKDRGTVRDRRPEAAGVPHVAPDQLNRQALDVGEVGSAANECTDVEAGGKQLANDGRPNETRRASHECG